MSDKSLDQQTPDELWESLWKPIVCNEDGSINVEQLKLELADFAAMIHNVALTYDRVTFGMVSKPTTNPDVVAALVDERISQAYDEGLQDGREIERL